MKDPNLCYTRNLSNSEKVVQTGNPWNQALGMVPEELCTNKKARSDWNLSEKTNHVFYSMYQGIDPRLRVSDANPPAKLLAIVADYDAVQSEAMLQLLYQSEQWKPNLIEDSPTPGFKRLIWLLDEPVNLPPDYKIAGDAVVHVVTKVMGAEKKLAGFDTTATSNCGTLFCRGNGWEVMSDKPLSSKFVAGAILKFLQDMKDIPLPKGDGSSAMTPEEAYPLLCECGKYPRLVAEWEEEFKVGAMGPSFLSPNAEHPRSTQVKPSGIFTWSAHTRDENGGKCFWTWEELLGKETFEKFKAERLESFTAGIFYDGKTYWVKQAGRELWQPFDREALRTEIKSRGAKSVTLKGETTSELENALVAIHNERRVHGACHFQAHPPAQKILFQGKPYLNLWVDRRVRGSIPSKANWGEGFPDIAMIIETQLSCPILLPGYPDPTDDQMKALMVQLLHLNLWRNKFTTLPSGEYLVQPGQVTILLGPGGKGKTLMVQHIFGRMMGGHSNASKFFAGDDPFGAENFESSVWIVDDASVATDYATQKRFTERVKAFVADQTSRHHAKFQMAVKVDTSGCRVFVILNDDPTSLSNAPLFSENFNDKIIVQHTLPKDEGYSFEDREKTGRLIEEQLPAFCAFVDGLDIKDEAFNWIPKSDRFGVGSYINQKVVKSILNNGYYATWVPLLKQLRDTLFDPDSTIEAEISTDSETGLRYIEMNELQAAGVLNLLSDNDPGMKSVFRGGHSSIHQKLRNACNQISAGFPELVTVFNDLEDDGIYKIRLWEKKQS